MPTITRHPLWLHCPVDRGADDAEQVGELSGAVLAAIQQGNQVRFLPAIQLELLATQTSPWCERPSCLRCCDHRANPRIPLRSPGRWPSTGAPFSGRLQEPGDDRAVHDDARGAERHTVLAGDEAARDQVEVLELVDDASAVALTDCRVGPEAQV